MPASTFKFANNHRTRKRRGDRFGLDGPRAISALEQAQLVARLAVSKLPISHRWHSIVRDIVSSKVKTVERIF
jgi:beta-lactamase class D